MSNKLEEMRKKIMEMENRKSGSPKSKQSFNDGTFPFWNMKDGEESTIRFLPDGDANNTFFWVERQLINIPFSGIEGDNSVGEVTVSVPCVEMWGEQCPIHQEIRPWYNQSDESLKKLASVYWKKRTYLFQGFVRNTKLVEESVVENPIRRFWFKPQVFNLIKTIIMDADVQYSPTHYEQGFDFYIAKSKKGQWADYSSSRWARGSSPLSQQERDAINNYGLLNLSEFLPKKPSPEDVRVMFDMFNVSLDGGKYDPQKWGQYYKPKGYDVHQKKEQVQVPSSYETQTTNHDDIPFDMEQVTQKQVEIPATVQVSSESTQSTGASKADDILARLRNRNKSA